MKLDGVNHSDENSNLFDMFIRQFELTYTKTNRRNFVMIYFEARPFFINYMTAIVASTKSEFIVNVD